MAAGVGLIAIVGAGLTSNAGPLRASAATAAPCGVLWTDQSQDSQGATGQDNNLDLTAGAMSDDGTALTTTLTVLNLSSTPTQSAEDEYYMVFTDAGGSYYTEADNSVANGVTYSYGTYSSTTGFSGVGTASGTFNPGNNGTITVTVPFSAVGSPASGSTLAASGIFGEAGYLVGATVQGSGGGVVESADKDTATSGYTIGSCSGTPTSPTPSPSATATATASASPTSSGGSTACTAQSPVLNVSENGWECPVAVPGDTATEPSIIADSGTGNGGVPRLFVTGPAGVPTAVSTQFSSPLYTSVDGGNTWTGPVTDTFCTGLAGGDTDLALDANDNLFETDLSLLSSCLGVSTTHGQSFAAGSPFGTEVQPGDDRPWIVYGHSANEIFGAYDGLNGVHVVNTAPEVVPQNSVQAVNDQIAIPESLLSSSAIPNNVRACVCPPGGIAVDNTSGTHAGRIYVAFSDQYGMAIAYADPVAGAVPPLASWHYTFINDLTSGSAFEDEWNFSPIKVDSNGVVYVMWAHAHQYNSSTELAGSGGVQEYYAYSTNGGATFSNPILLSTEDGSDGSQGTTTFPTLSIVGPGTLDAAWYGTTPGTGATGDPDAVSTSAQWNVYYTRVTNAASNAPTVAAPEIAIEDMHSGCIQTGGGASCSDRSLLDFFTIIDDPGNPDIIYAAGGYCDGCSGGDQVYFTKLLTAAAVSTPEAPLTALLLLPGAGVVGGVAVAVGRRRRRALSD
jgi:hypothetical protein